MRSRPRRLLLRPVIKESCILHYYHTNSGPSLSRVVPHERTIFCDTDFIVSWNGRKMKTTDRVASNWGISERWNFAQLKFHNDISFLLIVWTYKKHGYHLTYQRAIYCKYQSKNYHPNHPNHQIPTYILIYNRPYHQIPMYILTYIQLSIPSDTNVHINIHTTVHTTRYQCTY